MAKKDPHTGFLYWCPDCRSQLTRYNNSFSGIFNRKPPRISKCDNCAGDKVRFVRRFDP